LEGVGRVPWGMPPTTLLLLLSEQVAAEIAYVSQS
jgi:hypothetical protein